MILLKICHCVNFECMVPVWQRAYAQDIISKAEFGGGIRGTINRIWWFRRVVSKITWPDSLTPVDFFSRDTWNSRCMRPSQALQQRITNACVNVSPAMLQHVLCEFQTRLQMCIGDDGEKFEHEKYLLITSCLFSF